MRSKKLGNPGFTQDNLDAICMIFTEHDDQKLGTTITAMCYFSQNAQVTLVKPLALILEYLFRVLTLFNCMYVRICIVL